MDAAVLEVRVGLVERVWCRLGCVCVVGDCRPMRGVLGR